MTTLHTGTTHSQSRIERKKEPPPPLLLSSSSLEQTRTTAHHLKSQYRQDIAVPSIAQQQGELSLLLVCNALSVTHFLPYPNPQIIHTMSSPSPTHPNLSPASSSSSSVHEDGGGTNPHPNPPASDGQPKRPRLHSRKSSGTIIVPREHPRVELKEGDEVFDEDDARAMSPRRSSQDLEKISEDAKLQLNEYVTQTIHDLKIILE